MVIYLNGEVDEEARLDEMSPRQIVAELDKHVVGQRNAKRAVAVALRNRVRRQKLAPDMAVHIIPKHIIMICSTGTCKTPRSLAQPLGSELTLPKIRAPHPSRT